MELIACKYGVASGENAPVVWQGLTGNTPYEWYVVIDDGIESTESDLWRFTTQDQIPAVPALNPLVAILE